ncbi:MAG: hypothetical protein IIU28_00465, partial [Lachnospiraceae bacterium]|nr:hypothetical protein [Lachnospiraceae bacterium]
GYIIDSTDRILLIRYFNDLIDSLSHATSSSTLLSTPIQPDQPIMPARPETPGKDEAHCILH